MRGCRRRKWGRWGGSVLLIMMHQVVADGIRQQPLPHSRVSECVRERAEDLLSLVLLLSLLAEVRLPQHQHLIPSTPAPDLLELLQLLLFPLPLNDGLVLISS